MSDPFTPAKPADPAGPGSPDPSLSYPPPQTETDHMLAIFDRISAGFRQLAANMPMAAPLANIATAIDARSARIREMQPPKPGSMHDHS